MREKACLMARMMAYYHKDIRRINHTLKVFAYAHAIALGEELADDERKVTEYAAILHDIGIPESERIYGDSRGPHQEEQGAAVGRQLLQEAGVAEDIAERVVYLIAHHHSYGAKGEKGLQILFEADFLVNFEEGNLGDVQAASFKERLFRTATGIRLLDTLFG